MNVFHFEANEAVRGLWYALGFGVLFGLLWGFICRITFDWIYKFYRSPLKNL